MQTFHPDSSSLHYVSAGDGPAIILTHGLAASLHDWDELLPVLASAGYRAIAVDLPGHGESPKPDNPQSYHVRPMYTAFEGWLDGLGLQGPLLLVGHSLGGYLSLLYGMRHPERVLATVLVNPFYSPLQLSRLVRYLHRYAALGGRGMRLLPGWLVMAGLRLGPLIGENLSEQARRQTAVDLKRASPHVLHVSSTIRNLTPELARYPHPTLVLWGEHDHTLNPNSFPRLLNVLPNASGRSIPDSGHQPHVTRPELVNAWILQFLEEIQPAYVD